MTILTREEIEIRIKQLADEIFNDYNSRNINTINFIYILHGAFIFAADLCRELHSNGMKMIIGTIHLETYVGAELKVKYPQLTSLFNYPLKNRNILIIEDILDTGNTINNLDESLRYYNPKSIEYCCLLRKKHDKCVLNENINVKYVGFTIPNVFVVGMGLDYNGKYRELPFIKKLEENNYD